MEIATLSTTYAHDLPSIQELINKITFILNNGCNTCLTNFTSGLVSAPKCKNTCSYTSSGLAIIYTLIEQNPELKDYINTTTDITQIPIMLRVTSSDSTLSINDRNYMGIVNTIGLLWDIHDFPVDQFPDEKYREYKPTGIYYALQNKLDWFVEGTHPQLQPGVNLLSFYSGNDPTSSDPITIHHSFVYVWNDVCILVDSWNSSWGNDNKMNLTINTSGKEIRKIVTRRIEKNSEKHMTARAIGEILERPLSIRLYPLDLFQTKINIINDQPNEINVSEKINIMRCTFDGFKLDSYNEPYTYIKICILKQEKLNELIIEGFSANKFLYGGKKRRINRKNKSISKRKNKTKKYRKYYKITRY